MNPKLYANPVRESSFQTKYPYIEPSFGRHAADWTALEIAKQRIGYLRANCQVLPGFGKHRKNRVNAA